MTVFLVSLVGIAFNTAIVAYVATRLLDVRYTLWRLIFVSVVGQSIVQYGLVPAVIDLEGADPPPADVPGLVALLALAVVCAPVIAMTLLVIWEAILPTGAVPPLRTWFKGLRARAGRTRRYLQILAIAARHGLTGLLRGRRQIGQDAEMARSIRRALDDGGVTFVKLGQILSTRRDLLPPVYIAELAKLQDQAAPIPGAVVTDRVEAAIGAAVDEVFAEFDLEPMAAASVAQVHSAVLRTGEAVVVKVRRPGAADTIERDLDIIQRLAELLDRRTAWGRSMDVLGLAAGFAAALREEADFTVEARNLAQVAAAHDKRRSAVRVPRPRPDLSDERVLVMERFTGVSLAAAGPMLPERGLDPRAVAAGLLREVLDEIMIDGIFHADPHPGNLLLLDDDRLGLIDYGSVGRLDRELRASLQAILQAVDRQDGPALADALIGVSTRPDELDQVAFERALGSFMARHLLPGAAPGMRMFTELFRIIAKYRIAIPPELAAVFRALGTLEGCLTAIDPRFDIVGEARSAGEAYAQRRLRPDSVKDMVVEEAADLLPVLRKLPRRLDRLAAAAEAGRLTGNLRLFSRAEDRRTITVWLHQTLLTVLAAASGLMAAMLIGTEGGPAVTDDMGLYQFFGLVLLLIASVMALRVLADIFTKHHEPR
ncbi:phosphotransferase [Glycomyces sp. TRM65418]|uniref:ABC1 kinase family protein n=1 Tax=Glycomyces sp. TRM65418 TaxID=2867006 RepID=UPI001CE543E9|nr:AarF/UbiB family protein [Glycomyces sp. TRM65418]MCC3765832.1 phosphotransferase [Glycomyces sp. TRM65418]QZD55418.1 phosphotransferase [Glycomyces sp. TRM65418]